MDQHFLLRRDVGLRGDRVEAVGDLAGAAGGTVIDAAGLAVAKVAAAWVPLVMVANVEPS